MLVQHSNSTREMDRDAGHCKECFASCTNSLCSLGGVMTTIHDIQDFLALHRIAMVGVSRNAKDFSRALFRELCRQGYDMVPINLLAAEIEGRECFRSLLAVTEPVEGVVVMTPSTEALRVAEDCAAAGIRNLWFYRAGGQGAGS